MRITVLGSGSRGNALVVEFGTVRIAVDVGFGPRSMARRLRACGLEPESVTAAVLTHEHQDHAQGAFHARAKWRWSLIATRPTLASLGAGASVARLHSPSFGAPFDVEGVRVTLFSVPHDAAAPAAVLLEDVRSGARVGVAQDLGSVPDALHHAFRDLDAAVIEANHDPDMLRRGPYPPSLQRRVAGDAGHLSNDQAATWLSSIGGPRLQHVVLAHLSETNNTPALAIRAATRGLRGTGFAGHIHAGHQRDPLIVGSRPPAQFGLW